jgi:hypothetical protein
LHERLLHEMLVSIHWNILRLVWVSLKRETKPCLHSHGLLHAFSFLLCFVSIALVLGPCECAYVAGRGDTGVGNNRRYEGRPCHGNARRRDFFLGGYCDVR